MPTQKDDMTMPSGQHDHSKTNTAVLATHNPHDEQSGAVALPIVDSSTYVFKTALHGKIAFARVYCLQDVLDKHDPDGKIDNSMIYARLSTPTIDEAEKSMKAIEENADWTLLFPSGMSAITALLQSTCHQMFKGEGPLTLCKRDIVLHCVPIYGGTHAMFNFVMPGWGFTGIKVDMNNLKELRFMIKRYHDRIGLVYIETPANPTCTMVDIQGIAKLLSNMYFENKRPVLAVDNTFAGIFCKPLTLGADVTIYSATKYLGGHADLIAGFITGKDGRSVVIKHFTGDLVEVPLEVAVGRIRTIGGYTPSPYMAKQLWTHMQTYVLRMLHQASTAETIANWLNKQSAVEDVRFPTLLTGKDKDLYERQMTGPSAMIAFKIKGADEEDAFKFLDALKLVVPAVSLGATRTLACHPASWTHSDIMADEQRKIGITPNLIRLSVGLERAEDLIADLAQALEAV